VNKQGLRMLKNIKIATDAKVLHAFLGWEQEFFILKADLYRKRPDLLNCGRTLIGKLPKRNQQAELNYFAPPPDGVQKLLFNVQAMMLKLGVPMAVLHNEVACAQHEMSPIYCHSSFSCDNNVLFMEVMEREAEKMGLHALFHEKPFAGINGSGKHNNWSVGTDTGLNFFYPGEDRRCPSAFHHRYCVLGIRSLPAQRGGALRRGSRRERPPLGCAGGASCHHLAVSRHGL